MALEINSKYLFQFGDLGNALHSHDRYDGKVGVLVGKVDMEEYTFKRRSLVQRWWIKFDDGNTIAVEPEELEAV